MENLCLSVPVTSNIPTMHLRSVFLSFIYKQLSLSALLSLITFPSLASLPLLLFSLFGCMESKWYFKILHQLPIGLTINFRLLALAWPMKSRSNCLLPPPWLPPLPFSTSLTTWSCTWFLPVKKSMALSGLRVFVPIVRTAGPYIWLLQVLPRNLRTSINLV